jgi:hypothetical protein
MSSEHDDPTRAPSVQPTDSVDIDDAIESRVKERVVDRIEEDNRAIEAVVRELISEADAALAGESEYDAAEVLETIHYFLRNDDRLGEVLHPKTDDLDRQTKIQFRIHMRARDEGQQPPARQEYKTAVKVSKALRYIYAYQDTTRYVPVRMERLDIPGAKSPKEGEITPVGRRRIGKSQRLDETKEEVLINHDDCEHCLVIALPRKGKDSTIVNMCGNLKDEHGYKWFSCLDDGRNETPMTGIPNDEEPIQENLEQFNQEPKAYKSRVYVPDTSGVPDVLPGNFERFTIGIDTLTPRLILRLAGITTDDSNTMRRIGQALYETQSEGKGVERLVELLYEYSEEVEATITVTELKQDDFTEDDGVEVVEDAEEVEQDPSIREVRYEMGADKALKEAAESLMMLAGEGLVSDPGAETNLDIEGEFRNQDRVAILNCNFLKPRNEALKYIILNLWLRLIFRVRDDNSRLPRALLEIRELKDIAPSVLANAKYQKEVKALQSTIYEIATRGGSRRIMMLGSTQKLNDVYKPVRTNMPIKILLQLGEEEILTLDRSYNFSDRQKEQLESFDVGWGMLLTDGDAYWPIQWRGARCGLGLGDEHWLDRYGKAWGARVFQGRGDGWITAHRDRDYYVNVRTGMVHEIDVDEEKIPDLGEWHLVLKDIVENVPVTIDIDEIEYGDYIDDRVIDAALAARREHDIPSDLSLQKAERQTERTLMFEGKDEAKEERKRAILENNDVPTPLGGWAGTKKEKQRANMLGVLRALAQDDRNEIVNMDDLATASGVPKGTIGRWNSSNKEFKKCLEKSQGVWRLTNIGRRALKVDWDYLDAKID